MRVAVLGASPNPERYSNRAIHSLRAAGHVVIPVNPAHKVIEGLETVARLADAGKVDTVTIYVGPAHIEPIIPDIIAVQPRRVIINPGAESDKLTVALKNNGIEVLEACTLVLLRTGQF